MNRRAFLTVLSAIPAVALFPSLLRAEPKPIPLWLNFLQVYQAIESFRDCPDALFVSIDKMQEIAGMFELKPDYDEFRIPWGGDICGVPSQANRIEVAAGLGPRYPNQKAPRATLYLFHWNEDAFIRHEAGHLAVSYRISEVLSPEAFRLRDFARTAERELRGES